MPLKKLVLKPGVNQENTRYYSETGWYECDKIRFRQGTPETIGGWQRTSEDTYLGVCRSLFRWVALDGSPRTGVGTHLKFYLESGLRYFDITPIRYVTAAGDVTFVATPGSALLTVSNVNHGAVTGDFVTFSGAVSLGGNITAAVLNAEHQILSTPTLNTYVIQLSVTATAGDVGNGGTATVGTYQINVGPEIQIPRVGWGAGGWGMGVWGVGLAMPADIRLWSQANFGEDLVFAPRWGGIYYWDTSVGLPNRGVAVSSMPGASDVPSIVQKVLVSDSSRFVLAFGCNELGSAALDPMLVRWSDQESVVSWTPSATNQAGSLRLSQGSTILTALQTRQEILVLTDTSVYSLQYLGAPVVWGAQILADNTSCAGPNSVATASGVTYWMGNNKFYTYNGTVSTLNCDLRQHVFGDINQNQLYQVVAGTNEAFNEVWWFYPSANSTVVDKYVVYNYLENIWYYGTLGRTAWIDRGVGKTPLAATYHYNLVNHETGVDDEATATPLPINAYISSAEWDADDGHSFSFIYRILPDLSFRGSSTEGGPPQATLTITPLKNSGAGYTAPQSVGGSSSAPVTRIATAPIEEFTGQVFVRVRGRQFIFRIESNQLGTAWQLGAPRVDLRPDGRRG